MSRSRDANYSPEDAIGELGRARDAALNIVRDTAAEAAIILRENARGLPLQTFDEADAVMVFEFDVPPQCQTSGVELGLQGTWSMREHVQLRRPLPGGRLRFVVLASRLTEDDAK